MPNELTCPECGYKTPFYTCMRCGATIKSNDTPVADEPISDSAEYGMIPRQRPDNIPDSAAASMPEAAGSQDFSCVHHTAADHEKESDKYLNLGKDTSSTKKSNNYKGPSSTMKYIFIVLGIAVALLKTHTLLVQYRVLSPLFNPTSTNSYSPLPNIINKTSYTLIKTTEGYLPFPEMTRK